MLPPGGRRLQKLSGSLHLRGLEGPSPRVPECLPLGTQGTRAVSGPRAPWRRQTHTHKCGGWCLLAWAGLAVASTVPGLMRALSHGWGWSGTPSPIRVPWPGLTVARSVNDRPCLTPCAARSSPRHHERASARRAGSQRCPPPAFWEGASGTRALWVSGHVQWWEPSSRGSSSL